MSVCEKCGAKAYVTESRRKPSGDIRRRFRCGKCDYAWTIWNGPKPTSCAPEHRLSNDAILDILTNPSIQSVLAKRHNCSMSAIGRIRRGELHPEVHPEIPRIAVKARRPKKSCKKCIHYTGIAENPCDLGHKDPLEEGLTFAFYCCNFLSPGANND
jgi:transposase-like protein